MVERITLTDGTTVEEEVIKRRNGVVRGGMHRVYTRKATIGPRRVMILPSQNLGHRMDGIVQIGSIYRRSNVRVYTLMILVGNRPLFSPYGVLPLGVLAVGLVGPPRVGLVARGVAQHRGPQVRGVVVQPRGP